MKKLNSPLGRLLAHLEALLVDHGFLRALYRNLYQISNRSNLLAFRSNHPSPYFIRKLHDKQGLKTIISMRNADTTGQYLLEKETCDQLGITLTHHVMSSRSFPDPQMVVKAKQLLEAAKYPILIHCKSGADRAGLMSVFYKHFIEKKPIEDAVKQLSMKYGHFRWADTGKLDVFFDTFLAFQKQHPDTSFLDWVENHYDKPALDAQFHAQGWANIVVNKILHRE